VRLGESRTIGLKPNELAPPLLHDGNMAVTFHSQPTATLESPVSARVPRA
jgi:hypothetical protein